ncbi:MAG: DNA (cytosine-5-)-methyltransferase [Gammaproteobacteria bacterium]|nr:DNA (cytosine-5-)-methyltransferase [Gammaproteobacteria bacterium]
MPYDISESKRDWYRQVSQRSRLRKQAAARGELGRCQTVPSRPALRPETLMPIREPSGLTALSLFSGGGGLDLGFERAGFEHVASFDVLDVCAATLLHNRPQWKVFSGATGDVNEMDWSLHANVVDVLHGGPPCQPFSVAGKLFGAADDRDMWPAFTRAVLAIRPKAFVAENVPGLLGRRFASYVDKTIYSPLSHDYHMVAFRLGATSFGVPQDRQRVFFVGFRSRATARKYVAPFGEHSAQKDLISEKSTTLGARAALGLPDIGFDNCAPTLRSGFTGPRKTTSVLNSRASQKVWGDLKIWPNGVQKSRQAALQFPPENGHFRLSVQDCALLQGFPGDWHFAGAVYQVLGQIGNSVCPPVAYAVANSVADALGT